MIAWGCSSKNETLVEEVPSTPKEISFENATMVPDQIVLRLDEELASQIEKGYLQTRSAGDNPLSEYGIESLERVFPDAGEYEPRTRAMGLHRYYLATLRQQEQPTKVSADVGNVKGVLSSRTERTYFLRSFDDPYLMRYQWNLINQRYPKADIGVQKIWDMVTVGSSKVIVAVADQGVDYTHPDLASNMWTDENGYHGYNFYNDSPDITYSATFDTGHGTHVAGIISAVNNNGEGLSSIAGGDFAAGIPGVQIMSCQIFSNGYSATIVNCARAIKWAADHGAVISQNSWGDSADYNMDGYVSPEELAYYKQFGIMPEIKDAIDYFIKYAGCDNDGNQLPDSPMKGGVVIFAAGNEAIDYDPICAYEPVISVGAYGGSGLRASYSNYGSLVDICAPGGDGSYVIYSTVPGGQYKGPGWMGTSMACPHVSGVAALIVSYFGGEGFTADKCREYLLEGAIDGFITDTRKVGRKLDAYNSFAYAGVVEPDNQPPVIDIPGTAPTSVRSHETVSVEFNVSDPDNDNVTVELASPVKGVQLVHTYDYALVINALEMTPGQDYTVTIVARDNRKGETRADYTFRVLENNAPVIGAELPNVVVPAPRESYVVNLREYLTDPDGENLTFYSSDGGSNISITRSIEDGVLTAVPLGYGTSKVNIQAYDARKARVEASFLLVCRDTSDPLFVYPTRVERRTTLTNDSEQAVPTEINVYTSTGTTVLSTNENVSIYEGAILDLNDLVPGVYTVSAKWGGKTHRRSIVKL